MRIKLNTNDHRMEQCLKYKKKAAELGTFLDATSLDFDAIEPSHFRTPYRCGSSWRKYFYWKLENCRIAYFCPDCRCEMYGSWDFIEPEKELNSSLSTPANYKNNLSFMQKFDDIGAEIKNILTAEIESFQRMTQCPCCGGTLSHEMGYYTAVSCKGFNSGNANTHYYDENGKLYRYIGSESISEIFEAMSEYRNKIKAKCRKSLENTKQFTSSCDIPATAIISDVNKETILKTPSNLQEYLLNLIKLETNIYALTNRLTDLYTCQLENMSYIAHKKLNAITQAETQYYKNQQLVDCYQYEIETNNYVLPTLSNKPQEPEYKAVSFFNKKKVMAENEVLKANYIAAVKAYEETCKKQAEEQAEKQAENERNLAECQNKVDKAQKLLARLRSEDKQIHVKADTSSDVSAFAQNMIDAEVKETENLLKKLYECRNSLYSYNIVFSKYHNVVALSTFYEYLMAGRCISLEGADGAYNIYESEIRADRIIGQLSEVLVKLDDIKAGQYMIYTEMQQVNTNLNNLNATMNEALTSLRKTESNVETIAKNTAVIAYNTAATAYYSKVNAELTNALGYMVAFK